MTDDYYSSVDLTRNTQAKAEDINTRTQAIESGFAKLPNHHASAPSVKGFSEVFKIVNATGVDHPAAAGQVQNHSLVYAADSGSANAYVITLTPAPSAYAAGQSFKMKAANANTGGSTINVNSLGTKSIVTPAGVALSANDILAGGIYELTYDGTNFQLYTVTITTATVLDEDNMASNSATSVPSQQSTKAYVDAAGVVLAAATTAITPSWINKTSSDTLTAAEVNGAKIISNDGAGAEVILTWLTLSSGQRAIFYVNDAQYLQIKAPTGKKIRYLTTQTATAGYVRSNVVGNSIEIVAGPDELVILGFTGVWTYDS